MFRCKGRSHASSGSPVGRGGPRESHPSLRPGRLCWRSPPVGGVALPAAERSDNRPSPSVDHIIAYCGDSELTACARLWATSARLQAVLPAIAVDQARAHWAWSRDGEAGWQSISCRRALWLRRVLRSNCHPTERRGQRCARAALSPHRAMPLESYHAGRRAVSGQRVRVSHRDLPTVISRLTPVLASYWPFFVRGDDPPGQRDAGCNLSAFACRFVRRIELEPSHSG